MLPWPEDDYWATRNSLLQDPAIMLIQYLLCSKRAYLVLSATFGGPLISYRWPTFIFFSLSFLLSLLRSYFFSRLALYTTITCVGPFVLLSLWNPIFCVVVYARLSSFILWINDFTTTAEPAYSRAEGSDTFCLLQKKFPTKEVVFLRVAWQNIIQPEKIIIGVQKAWKWHENGIKIGSSRWSKNRKVVQTTSMSHNNRTQL